MNGDQPIDKQLNFLQGDDPKKDEYYCPECWYSSVRKMVKMMQNLEIQTLGLESEELMCKSTIHMALYILSDAQCPDELLKPIIRWFEGLQGQFSQEQEDKLKLIKWNRNSGQTL